MELISCWECIALLSTLPKLKERIICEDRPPLLTAFVWFLVRRGDSSSLLIDQNIGRLLWVELLMPGKGENIPPPFYLIS